ncbi:MAG: ferritin-like domain-containing protein [Bacteroidota bacterium]
METIEHRRRLIRILQNAYSGEQAAAYAYRGHWKSLGRHPEFKEIQRIEAEEWYHREEVGRMLTEMGARPVEWSEIRTWIIGRTLGVACHLIGWFLPMYFAGRLERGNAAEYDYAANHATALNLPDYARELTVMADVEREHEIYFRSVIAGHPMLPRMKKLFGWG